MGRKRKTEFLDPFLETSGLPGDPATWGCNITRENPFIPVDDVRFDFRMPLQKDSQTSWNWPPPPSQSSPSKSFAASESDQPHLRFVAASKSKSDMPQSQELAQERVFLVDKARRQRIFIKGKQVVRGSVAVSMQRLYNASRLIRGSNGVRGTVAVSMQRFFNASRKARKTVKTVKTSKTYDSKETSGSLGKRDDKTILTCRLSKSGCRRT